MAEELKEVAAEIADGFLAAAATQLRESMDKVQWFKRCVCTHKKMEWPAPGADNLGDDESANISEACAILKHTGTRSIEDATALQEMSCLECVVEFAEKRQTLLDKLKKSKPSDSAKVVLARCVMPQ